MANLEMRIWGLIGAAFAAAFAIWMLFFPDRTNEFAWVIEPRLAAVFIGGGYIFRTAFFLNVAIWPTWNASAGSSGATSRSPGRSSWPRSGTRTRSAGARSSATRG